MGRGTGSNPETRAPEVAVAEFEFVFLRSASEQAFVCEHHEEVPMRDQHTVAKKPGDKRTSITATLRLTFVHLLVATMLVFGYGDGSSPSSLADSANGECHSTV